MDNVNIQKEMRTAIKKGDLEQVILLTSNNKEVLALNTPFGSWLHVAASFGKLDIVKYLISSGLDVNGRSGVFGGAAIKEAASDGHLEVVSYLIEQGSELDVSDSQRNPLFGAIYGGHMEIVKLLIAKGIDVSVKYTGSSMTNMDAYAFALERGQTAIAEILKAAGSQN